jgi:polyhydroxybutyrate depolymerase
VRRWIPLAIAAAGCGDNAARASGDEELVFTMGGLDRRVIVHAPPGRPLRAPLVFDLHGSGGTAAGHQQFSGLDPLADVAGFIAAYGEGAIPLGGGHQWHLPGQPLLDGPEPADAPDDVAYLGEAVRVINERFAVDLDRVYATGFSGGARMASQLGCDLVGIVGIAPIGGVRFPGPCQNPGVTVIAFHGTVDASNPYGGNGAPYWTYGVPEAMRGWAEHGGCTEIASLSRPAPTAELSSFPGCAGDALVQLYTLEGEGHVLPQAVDAHALMWEAFRERSRR